MTKPNSNSAPLVRRTSRFRPSSSFFNSIDAHLPKRSESGPSPLSASAHHSTENPSSIIMHRYQPSCITVYMCCSAGSWWSILVITDNNCRSGRGSDDHRRCLASRRKRSYCLKQDSSEPETLEPARPQVREKRPPCHKQFLEECHDTKYCYKIQIGYSTYTLIYKYPDESTIIPAVKVVVNKV